MQRSYLDKYHFDLAVDRRIVINYICHGVDQFDGQLRIHIAGCRLRTEDKGSREEVALRMLLQIVIQVHHVQDVEQLALVLMQTLYLHIEDGSRIHIDAVVLLDILCQTHLVLILDVHKFLLCFLVIRIHSQLLDLGQVGDPLVTDVCRYPVCQQRVSVQQEAALRDTVGLVVEFLREHFIEIMKFLILKDLGMKACYAVN